MEFKGKTVLILGGNSDVGKSLARDLAKLGSNLIITTRVGSQLNSFKSDLEIRYSIKCKSKFFLATDFNSHLQFYENLKIKPDIVVCCIGYLDCQVVSQKDFKETLNSIESNYVGLVSILNIISNDFEKRKYGLIVGISSVAGNRGRGSNYIYGSAKSGFAIYLSGLRNRLQRSNVHVITVKPGFIKSKMTQNINFPHILSTTPQEVSSDIIKAIKRRRNVVYTKWYWKWIMMVIGAIPECMFKYFRI